MATKKVLHEALRADYLKRIADFFTENGEEVLTTGSNEIAMPCVDSEGNDEFITITVKVPTGSRDGEPYDGYSMAEDFTMKQAEKARKAEEAAAKKQKKMERDAKARAKKQDSKAAHKARQEAEAAEASTE